MTLLGRGRNLELDRDTTAPRDTTPPMEFTLEVTEAEWPALLAHVHEARGRVITSCFITVRVDGHHLPGYVVTWEQP